jgi:hypothetical protein
LSDDEIYIVFTLKDLATYVMMIIVSYVFFCIVNSWFGIYSSSIALAEAIMSSAFIAWWTIMNGIETGDSRIGEL